MSAQPRLVVSAPSSGHGKTAIAVGLLAAAAARGIPAAGFKVGPDHTDAAYLGLAAGRPGRNLDPRLVGAQRIAPLFAHGANGARLSVVEGAMGLFDSLTGQPEIDGTAAVAATLRAPVVLVVDVATMGHSIAALVHGFRMFDEMVHLGGVILNRVASNRHEQMLRTALDDIGMPVLGALRHGDLPNVLPARGHGPVPVAHRTVEASRAVRRLGEAVASCLDLERIMAVAESAPALGGPIWTPAEAVGGELSGNRPVVALAGGPGALYTYVETAELLTAAGADVVIVDPLRDEALPVGARALIVGGGLPEGFAEELSANRRLCAEVAQFARDGWPLVAEGVALPWLVRDFDGRPMCGVFDASAVTGEQTIAGYREAAAPITSSLAPAGARITGYKQHRAMVTPRAGMVPAWTWSGGNPEGYVWRQVHASQLGLHWAAAPEIAKRLVGAALAGPAPGGPGGVPVQSGPAAPTYAGPAGVPVQSGPAAPAYAGPADLPEQGGSVDGFAQGSSMPPPAGSSPVDDGAAPTQQMSPVDVHMGLGQDFPAGYAPERPMSTGPVSPPRLSLGEQLAASSHPTASYPIPPDHGYDRVPTGEGRTGDQAGQHGYAEFIPADREQAEVLDRFEQGYAPAGRSPYDERYARAEHNPAGRQPGEPMSPGRQQPVDREVLVGQIIPPGHPIPPVQQISPTFFPARSGPGTVGPHPAGGSRSAGGSHLAGGSRSAGGWHPTGGPHPTGGSHLAGGSNMAGGSNVAGGSHSAGGPPPAWPAPAARPDRPVDEAHREGSKSNGDAGSRLTDTVDITAR